MKNRQTKQDRIDIVNEIIKEISNHGRRFFYCKDRISCFILFNNRLYMYNQYNEQNMYLSAKSIYAPKGFPQGGTFWALTKDFRDFILTGNKSNGENGYGGLFCTHWGYSIDDMLRIQNKAVELGYL